MWCVILVSHHIVAYMDLGFVKIQNFPQFSNYFSKSQKFLREVELKMGIYGRRFVSL